MDTNLKTISDQLHSTLTAVTEINEKQKSFEEKHGHELGELKENFVAAITDFDAKLEKGEKIQKDIEKKIVDIANFSNTEDTLKDLKSYNKMLTSYGRQPVDREQLSEVTKAFDRYVRFGPRALMEAEHKALNTVIDPQGGFFVLPEYSNEISELAIEPHGILDIVDRVNVSTSPIKFMVDWFPWDDDIYKNELDPLPTPTTPSPFREVTIPVTTQFYGMPFSRELLEDSYIDIQTHVIGRMREGMDNNTGRTLVLGDGADKPHGILQYPNGTGFGNIEQIVSGTSSIITWDDVMIALPSAGKSIYTNNSVSSYLMNKRTFYDLLGDKDGSSRYQISNQVNFFSGQGISLGILGSDVVWEPSMPLAESDALAVAFGDFRKAYKYVERVGFSLHRDDSNAATLTLTLRRRNGGGVVNFEAIKLLKILT